ncbi:FAD-dependent oxidoreductase [Georgenia faecalis]|uniref:FAD-dependent oxidoreductase n=1 Tax=Georgenia faecalis TaxID=2483799 RepID=UPI000FDC29FD|nr:FAD-dependent oxidoreductase [Georgenia faecalis]
MRGSAVVIGGGIAGLAVARGLLRAGWSVRVLERSADLPQAGTALGMWPEAMRALDALGAGDDVRAASVEQRGAAILRPDGTPIARIGRGRTARLVSRPALLAALARGRPGETVEWGRRVDGSGVLPEADVVVGADGVRSVVRAVHFGVAPRALGTIAYRGTAPGAVRAVSETWGRSQLFGITPRHDGATNWFACLRDDADGAGARRTEAEAATRLRELYGDWHRGVQRVLDHLADVDERRLYDVPPLPSYVAGNVVLVGDAAHAMAPNLGRGACETLLDAAALTEALSAAPDVASGLRQYDAARRPAATRVVRMARLANRLSTAEHLVPARNVAVAAAARLS